MIQSNAVFDILFIGRQLQDKLNDFSSYELQLFTYLSCLLSIFDHKPVAFWGYAFIKNDLGSPYSRELEDAIEGLLAKRSLKLSDGFLRITEMGKNELESYSSFYSNRVRIKFLQATCDSINLLSYGLVKKSISQEPILFTANHQPNKRLLIDDEGPAFSVLYRHFEMLTTALGNQNDNLVLPAVVWLNYLERKGEELLN